MKLFTLQFMCQLISFYGIYHYWNDFSLAWVLVIILGMQVFTLTLFECFMHRYCSHNSYKLNHYVESFLTYFSTLCTFGPALTFAANHKKHHRNSDKEGDSHPASDGLKTYFWFNINKYHTTSRDILSVRRLMKKKHFNIQSKHYFKIWFLLFTPFVLINPMFALCFILIPGVITFNVSGIVNVICHNLNLGYRNFDTNDNSVNINLLFIPGTLHNNHHNNPGSPSVKVKWHELDIGEYVIKAIRT